MNSSNSKSSITLILIESEKTKFERNLNEIGRNNSIDTYYKFFKALLICLSIDLIYMIKCRKVIKRRINSV